MPRTVSGPFTSSDSSPRELNAFSQAIVMMEINQLGCAYLVNLTVQHKPVRRVTSDKGILY
jgi:hypothetical protein